MALKIDDAERSALDALYHEYEQELVTEQQSTARLQGLMFDKMKFLKDALQASADQALSASNTPQEGQQLLAHGQPPSPSEMPPSPPQSLPPAPHAEAGGGTNESLAGVLGAMISALNKQSSSVATALPKMARSVHPNTFSDKKDDRPDRWIKSFVKFAGINDGMTK